MKEYIKYGVILLLIISIIALIWKIFYDKKEGYENIITKDSQLKEPVIIRPPSIIYPNANSSIIPAENKEELKSIFVNRPKTVKKLVADKKVTFSDFDIISKTKSPISTSFDYEVFNKYNPKYTDFSELKF